MTMHVQVTPEQVEALLREAFDAGINYAAPGTGRQTPSSNYRDHIFNHWRAGFSIEDYLSSLR